jgi:hypothetical protein
MQINVAKLSKVMNTKGITRSKLLIELGDISEGTWYRWKREGFPQIAILAIAQVLDVKASELTKGCAS